MIPRPYKSTEREREKKSPIKRNSMRWSSHDGPNGWKNVDHQNQKDKEWKREKNRHKLCVFSCFFFLLLVVAKPFFCSEKYFRYFALRIFSAAFYYYLYYIFLCSLFCCSKNSTAFFFWFFKRKKVRWIFCFNLMIANDQHRYLPKSYRFFLFWRSILIFDISK